MSEMYAKKSMRKKGRGLHWIKEMISFNHLANFDPKLTRYLMTMLFIDAEIPFLVIESQFRKPAMKSLRPKYRAVERQTLRNDHVRVFKTEMEVSLKEFEELDSHVSFTSDIWTQISQIHI